MSGRQIKSPAVGVLLLMLIFNPLAIFAQTLSDDYNGASQDGRLVVTRIGSQKFQFPRNYILNNINGLRLGLDLSTRGGADSINFDQFGNWGGGRNAYPSLIEVEITSGSVYELMSSWYKAKLDTKPDEKVYGLSGFHSNTDVSNYLLSKDDFTVIFCDTSVGNCQMRFDTSGRIGVRVLFASVKLTDWLSVREFVRKVVSNHRLDAK